MPSSPNLPYSLPFLWYRRARLVGTLAYGLLLYLPSQIICNAIPRWRPDPEVSALRTVAVSCLRWFIGVVKGYRDVFNPLPEYTIVQSRLDELGVQYEKAPAWQGEIKGEVGEAAARRGIQAVDVSIFWGGKKGQTGALDRGEAKVLVSFHGGGYVGNTAHPDDPSSYPARKITDLSKTIDLFCTVDYRLSSIPVGQSRSINPFPAALLDALTAVKHIFSLGYQAENLYLFGDSAGGNLALALCRYLLFEENIRVGGLILMSPWADISGSHSKLGLSRVDNKKCDFLGDDCEPNSYNYFAFLGGPGDLMSPESPYISPACRDIESPSFKGLPRTFISAGGNEQFLDEIKLLHARMGAYLSENDLRLDVTEHAPHDFIVLGSLWEPERTELMQRIAEWVDETT